jgi:diguanylate cyclase (GGDEF)-like protein
MREWRDHIDLSLDLQPMRQQWIRGAYTALSYGLIYLAADVALNRFAFSDGWTIVWPLNGVTVALLLMRPRSAWLYMLLGIEIGTGIGECLDDNSWGLEIGQRVCSVVEVLICAALLPACSALATWLRTPRIHARFFAALVLGPGTSGLMAAILFHSQRGDPYLLAFNNWATADALGVAATLPLVLALKSPQMRALFARAALPKTLGTLLVCFLGSTLIFSVNRYPLTFLLYPLLLLVDTVLAFAGSAIAVVGVCLIAVYFTTNGWGPFGAWSTDLFVSRDLALQLYFGFHVVALFPFSVLLMERRRLAEELRHSHARLKELASLDGLTGIGNRRAFDERFSAEWNRAVLQRNSIAIAIIDLDNFKQFNDLYGHPEGDNCLRAVAGVLSVEMRKPDDFAARFGGEEFAILLPNTSADDAFQVAERLRTAILNLGITHLGNPWNRVSVSIGYSSTTPTSQDTQLGLIQLADAALYRAKHLGRNCVETIKSREGLRAANDHLGDTTQVRLMRLLRRADR